MLILILTVSMLTACDGNGGASNPSALNSGGNSNSSTNTPAQTDSVSHDYDQVIFDGEGLKVTVTGYYFGTNKFGGLTHSFYYTVENNSDKNISCNFKRVSVNGCMIDSALNFSLNTSDKTGAGTINSDAYVEFTDSYLTDRGITEVRDIEFTIFFGDRDDFNKTLFDSGPVTIQVPNGSDATQTFDTDGVVLFNGGGVKITAIKVDYDIFYGLNHGIWVFIENNSGVAVHVTPSRTYVGKNNTDGQITCTVANGKVAYDYIVFGNSYEKLEEVWLNFAVDPLDEDASGNKWGLKNESEPDGVTISFDGDGKAIFVSSGSIYY